MSVTHDLLKLIKLREKGRLTESEYVRAKAAVLEASEASGEERLRIEEEVARASDRAFLQEPRRPWSRSVKVTVLVVLALLALFALPLIFELIENWLFTDGASVLK
jgi:hypothetical protein